MKRYSLSPFSNIPVGFFDDFGTGLNDVFSREGNKSSSFYPQVDFSEDENNHVIHAELPGVNADDFHVEVKDNILTISGEKKALIEKPNYVERSYGSFKRSFTLPTKVDKDSIEANMKNGVLTVLIPKVEKEESKRINVQHV